MFSFNSYCSKSSSKKSNSEDDSSSDFAEIGGFQLVLRTLRTTLPLLPHGNISYTALENYLTNNKFCKEDLQRVDKPAFLLTQFVDYVLVKKAAKWRSISLQS
jgi:hypothetical protein